MIDKQKIIATLGLPASGKSTWAKTLDSNVYKRVNKDDLRMMIDNGVFSKENEKVIRELETSIVVHLLKLGFSVIVDSTNYNYIDYWKNIAAESGVDFEVKEFKTNVLDCVSRNAQRIGYAKVPAKSIWDMYFKHVEPNIQRPEWLPTGPTCYLVDIDGTIARMNGRSAYDWKRVGEDSLNENLAGLINTLRQNLNEIIFLSGRDEICRVDTEKWLAEHGVQYDGLLMRPRGDIRKDSIVKKELYERHILGKKNILGVFDDRDQVVALWRELGLNCYQVNYGSF